MQLITKCLTLLSSPKRQRWSFCCSITFPWLCVLSEIAVFSRGDVRLQVDGMQGEKREECKVTVSVKQEEGTLESSSLTSAREMLPWDRRYAWHRVISWSAASCKTWTLFDWRSSSRSSISYIKALFSSEVAGWCLRREWGAGYDTVSTCKDSNVGRANVMECTSLFCYRGLSVYLHL